MPYLPSYDSIRQGVDLVLGPEGQRSDNLTDLYIGSLVMRQATGERRYMEHNERMFQIARRHGLGTDVMAAAIGFHDVVEGLFSSDEVEQASTQRFLEDRGNSIDLDSKRHFMDAVGYAMAGHHLEAEIAEAWREPTLDEVDKLTDVNEDDRTLIKQAINKRLPEDTDVAHLERLLKRTRMLDLDLGLLTTIINPYDAEGALLKSIELIDNLDKPNRPERNPASTWRDAIEALTCWGPICDYYGYFELGSELRGKAYEFFYEDNAEVAGRAEAQHALSEKHVERVGFITELSLREAYRGYGSPTVTPRVKTVGSIEQKLIEDQKYQGKTLLPDGIGIRIIVPDRDFNSHTIGPVADTMIESLTRLRADNFGPDTDEFSIDQWHPLGIEEAREDRLDGGVHKTIRTYNMTFMMTFNGEQVPFEVQFLSESENVEYVYGPNSHPLYKLKRYNGRRGTAKIAELEQAQVEIHLQSFLAKADFLREHPNEPAINPNTWFDLVRLLPNLETPLHEVYGVNERGVMMPKQLVGTPAAEAANGEGQRIILPPGPMTETQFIFLLDLLDPSLSTDRDIARAIRLVKDKQGKFKRRDGVTDDVDGHIFPVTAYAAIVATVSGQRWVPGDQRVDLKKLIMASLLHDTLEDVYGGSPAERAIGIGVLNQEFGWETTHSVMSMTLPLKPENETHAQKTLRRGLYVLQVLEDFIAKNVKPADRLQNHTLDLVRMMDPDLILSDVQLEWVEMYRSKTEAQSKIFSAMPHDYYRHARRIVWKMLTESLRVRRNQPEAPPESEIPEAG